VAAIAQALPETDFIGIEVHTPGVGALLRQIGERFRVERASVEAVLDPSSPTEDGDECLTRAATALHRMACRVGPVMERLRAAAERGEVSGELYQGRWSDVGTPARLAELKAQLDRR